MLSSFSLTTCLGEWIKQSESVWKLDAMLMQMLTEDFSSAFVNNDNIISEM